MLKVVFLTMGNVLCARITDMSEGIRGNLSFTASNGYRIRSYERPDFDERIFYVRGNDRDRDNDIIFYKCRNSSEAVLFANKIISAITELTKNDNSAILIVEKDLFNVVNIDGTLKLNMLKWDNWLFVKIVDMDDKDRGNKRISHNNITIKSANHPQLTENILFVRGTYKSRDDEISYYRFDSFSEIKTVVDDIKAGVNIWNNNTENTVQFYDFIPIF